MTIWQLSPGGTIENSPRLQPWDGFEHGSNGRGSGKQRWFPAAPIGAFASLRRYPRLKPWATLYHLSAASTPQNMAASCTRLS